MSQNVYYSEPVTSGKVLLVTSFGDFDIELWPKEAPKACRNFVQLCLEGYYDGCVFHRVITDFMAQTGDPTGTGKGGQSIYGEPFADEFHGRLRFTHRGLVAMANSGPGTNTSQFFLTLDKCEWLKGKNTIFGRITGQTIYNLNRFANLDVDDEDRPLHPPIIHKTTVLSNPFPDIVPRVKAAPSDDASKKQNKKKKKSKTKDLSKLSFGAEQEELDEELQQAEETLAIAKKSSHDLLDDPNLLPDTASPNGDTKDREAQDQKSHDLKERIAQRRSTQEKPAAADAGADAEEDAHLSFDQRMRRKVLAQSRAAAKASGVEDTSVKRVDSSTTEVRVPAPEQPKPTDARAEYMRIKAEMKQEEALHQKSVGAARSKAFVTAGDDADDELLTPLQRRRKQYIRQKRRLKDRSADTLAKLAAFQSNLRSKFTEGSSTPQTQSTPAPEEQTQTEPTDEKHQTSKLEMLLDNEDEEVDESWMTHRVKFVGRPTDYDPMARRTDNTLDFVEWDPRDPKNKGKEPPTSFRAKNTTKSGMSGWGVDRSRDRHEDEQDSHSHKRRREDSDQERQEREPHRQTRRRNGSGHDSDIS